jgi:D-xylose transport system ATP-binding protein
MADSVPPSSDDDSFSDSFAPPPPASTSLQVGEPRLKLRGITKNFGAVRALYDVDFEVYPGEVVGLVGDNGAGKSTLIKTIAGVYIPDEGGIFMDGQPLKITSPVSATRLGIETVYQDLALCDNLDVVANLYLGREKRIAPWFAPVLQETEMERRTLEVLSTLDVKIPSVRVPVASLSGGQRQSIAVAKTILRNARVVLLDEPTAALGVAQTRQVLNLIRRLREQGLAVVVISHNLHDVFEVVDRVIVLRLGQRVGSYNIKTTTPEQVIAAITGATFGEEAAANDFVEGV